MPFVDDEWGEWNPAPWNSEKIQKLTYWLDILKDSVLRWNQWREQNPNESIDLHGVSFQGWNLSSVNFESINLRYTNLTDTDLTNANLTNADLGFAKLTGAKLAGAKLNGTLLDQSVKDEPILQQNTKRENQSQSYNPCLRDFRKWYFTARETGRNHLYLKYIQSLAEDFKVKTPKATLEPLLQNPNITVLAEDLSNLQLDAAKYQSLYEQFSKDAKALLEFRNIRKSSESEEVLECQYEKYLLIYYNLFDLLLVRREGKIVLYHQKGDRILCEKYIRQEDAKYFRNLAMSL